MPLVRISNKDTYPDWFRSTRLTLKSADWDRTTTFASLLHEELEFCEQEPLILDGNLIFFLTKIMVSSQHVSLCCETSLSCSLISLQQLVL